MIKPTFMLIPLISVATWAQTIVDLDFNEAGFTDGGNIQGIQNMSAQAGSWRSYDTAGTGYLAATSTWGRAENYASFSLDIGHSVVIESTLRLSDADGSYANSEGFLIGFAEASQHTGQGIPTIGSKLYTYSDGSYWFGGDAPENRISVGAADNGDLIRFTQWITRSAASNAFTGIILATNLTDGTDLGHTSAEWAQSTVDGSWGGTMQPGFRVLLNSGVTAMELDRWVVSTTTEPPPSITNPPPVIVTNATVVSVDLTRRRSIAGTTALDREQWFGVYHETGYARTQFTDGGQTMSFDEWINEEGRMWPSRGTVNFENMAEDPTRPSYVDPSEFSSLNNLFDWRYAWAKDRAPYHKTVLSGEGHGKYPAYMCWDPALTHNVKTVSNNVAHAEAMVRILAQLDARDGLMPRWLEVMNESSIQSNYGWHWDSDAWDKLSEFHAKVGEAVAASVYSNSVKVAGPTDAYPYRDGSAGDFSQWENTNKKFIQLAGGKMGAYAIHTYEQMTTNSNSSFDDQFARFEIWHQGRLPSFIDLWETEHNIVHGGTLPFVFSEYGLLTNRNPYGDENAYYQLRSCNGILLALLDRPDVVDKMSAFLMSQAPYNWSQKRVFFASNNSGATWYKTSYFEYLRFWHDLEGDYLFSTADSQHLAQHAFLADNGNTLFVVIKNNHNRVHDLDLQLQLPPGAAVTAAQIQRLYYNGVDDVARDPFTAVSDLSSVLIVPDETIMLKIQLAGIPALLTWHERNVYSDRTLVPMAAGTPESFTFDLPTSSVEPFSEGVVHISLYAFAGFTAPLTQVEVNGTSVTNIPDISYTAGAPRSWKQIKVPVPAGILQSGVNTVTITPAESAMLGKITSVRLTAVGATGDEDADGMPDWWEMDNSLNPWVNDAASHADADGVSNGEEYIALTDPQDARSILKTHGDADPAGFRVSIDSRQDRVYAVQTTEDLQTAWTDLTNGIAGDGGWIDVIDTEGKTNRFYRIRVELE